MTELYFYHLQNQPLERVLPPLLEKSLERGWRVVVQAGSQERVEALDAHLWTYREDGFLPHATERDSDARDQPIVCLHDSIHTARVCVSFAAWLRQPMPPARSGFFLFEVRTPPVARAQPLAILQDKGFEVAYGSRA